MSEVRILEFNIPLCFAAMTSKREHPHADMEDSDPPSTPSKKLKLEKASISTDIAMKDTSAESPSVVRSKEGDIIATDPIKCLPKDMNETSQSVDQTKKEEACGITEFVSPNLQGFTGYLKKRYAFSIFEHHDWA